MTTATADQAPRTPPMSKISAGGGSLLGGMISTGVIWYLDTKNLAPGPEAVSMITMGAASAGASIGAFFAPIFAALQQMILRKLQDEK